MAMIGKFLHIMTDDHDMKLIDISRRYGVPLSTLSGWYHDRSNAPLEFIMQLAEDTHVSVENIMNNVYFAEDDNTPSGAGLSAAEKRVITYMRRMNPSAQELLESIAQKLGTDSCFTE